MQWITGIIFFLAFLFLSLFVLTYFWLNNSLLLHRLIPSPCLPLYSFSNLIWHYVTRAVDTASLNNLNIHQSTKLKRTHNQHVNGEHLTGEKFWCRILSCSDLHTASFQGWANTFVCRQPPIRVHSLPSCSRLRPNGMRPLRTCKLIILKWQEPFRKCRPRSLLVFRPFSKKPKRWVKQMSKC